MPFNLPALPLREPISLLQTMLAYQHLSSPE
jgi:hypothetical protein